MKGARGGSLKIYVSVLTPCSNRNIDHHKSKVSKNFISDARITMIKKVHFSVTK